MAVKIKKKSNKPTDEELLEKDDQILEASRDTFNWLSDNAVLVGAVVAGLVIAVLVGVWFIDQRKTRIAEASADAYEALAVSFQPVGEAPTPAEGQDPIPASEVFATQQEKLEALRRRASEVVEKYQNRRAGNEARLLVASAALELGDAAEALDGYQAFRETSDTRLGELVATMGEASAMAANGDLTQALQVIDDIMGRYGNLRANLALQKARLIDTYGEPKDARLAYQQILDSDYALDGVDTGALETRIALLDIELGTADSAADTTPTDTQNRGEKGPE